MKSALIFTGIGLLSPSSLALYAIYTNRTLNEIGLAAAATAVLGFVLMLLGLHLGNRKERA